MIITEMRARSSRISSSPMSSICCRPQAGREHRDGRLHVDPDVAGVHRQRERLGRRQAGVELPVDQQAPDVAEAHLPDEVLDVDAAVAERAALLVGLGDLRLEGDDALEAGLEGGLSAMWRLLARVVAGSARVSSGGTARRAVGGRRS
jgi:hypothetical protein